MFGAEVAQSVEHSAENAGVASSILALGTSAVTGPAVHRRSPCSSAYLGADDTLMSGSSSVVEHILAKDGVEGSNPFSRSRYDSAMGPGAVAIGATAV